MGRRAAAARLVGGNERGEAKAINSTTAGLSYSFPHRCIMR